MNFTSLKKGTPHKVCWQIVNVVFNSTHLLWFQEAELVPYDEKLPFRVYPGYFSKTECKS